MRRKTWVMWWMNVMPVQLKLKGLCELVRYVFPLVSMPLLFVHPSPFIFMRTQDFPLLPVFIFLTFIWMAFLWLSDDKTPLKSRTIDIVDKDHEITTVASTNQTEKQDTCHSEPHTRWLMRLKIVFLRLKMVFLRLKHGIFEIQNGYSETQNGYL